MNYKIIYSIGDIFPSLADFEKAYLIEIDGCPILISYRNGERIPLTAIRLIQSFELENFGTMLRIETESFTAFAAVAIISFKGGLAVGSTMKTKRLKTELDRLCGFKDPDVAHYGYYAVPKRRE